MGFSDTKRHFQCVKTFRNYYNSFCRQLDEILSVIISDIKKHEQNSENYENKQYVSVKQKLKAFFKLLNKLIELLKPDVLDLDSEVFPFFHCYYFDKSERFLLDSS